METSTCNRFLNWTNNSAIADKIHGSTWI